MWQLSIAAHDAQGPVAVLRWSPNIYRAVERARDLILLGLGTAEPLIEDREAPLISTRQWRKPLSIAEIAQMAPTAEVRARPGRA